MFHLLLDSHVTQELIMETARAERVNHAKYMAITKQLKHAYERDVIDEEVISIFEDCAS